ncbi:MAG: TRAP transporter large permease subunit [Methylacidiphilales bacterium]|nr:TRAP transporter large permease subunit [Candidatus Methylacidiphilales bacterium]
MEYFAPVMFIGLVAILLIGFPVVFSLSALGLFCAGVAIYFKWFPESFLLNLPLNIFGILSNELLLAIPFFTLMGAILERCGLAESLLESLTQLFRNTRGGLAYAVIVVGFILGAITGTVAGQIIAMAMISLPIMIHHNYNLRFATGVLAASGTITQLIPPSLVLVILADQLQIPVNAMYQGAWGPSIIQMLLFLAFTFFWSLYKPQDLPIIPRTENSLQGYLLIKKCLKDIVPTSILILTVLGSMGGLPGMSFAIATPTEAGALGALGAMVLALCYKKLTIQYFKDATITSMRLTAMVVFILIGSRVFSLVFQGVDGNEWVEKLISEIPYGQLGFLIAANLLVFGLSFFLDFFEIAFIVLPLLVPIAVKLDINLVWFGVMICVTMQTSFMHPPFGFALFYLRGVTDTLFKQKIISKNISSKDMYLGAIPWLCLQLLLVVLVIVIPEIVTIFLDTEKIIDVTTIDLNTDQGGYGLPSSDPYR